MALTDAPEIKRIGDNRYTIEFDFEDGNAKRGRYKLTVDYEEDSLFLT